VLYFFDRDVNVNALNYFEQPAHGGSGVKAPFSRQHSAVPSAAVKKTRRSFSLRSTRARARPA